MKIFKYFLMAALVLPCGMLMSCGDDDDDNGGKQNVENPETPILNNEEALKYIDASYSPAKDEIQKTWVGNYEGWDENQQKNTKIKRLLTLNANGSYTNVIEGILVQSGKDKYTKFEHEMGTWTYNASSKTVTYTVRVDSVLNYGDQKMVAYTKKKYYDHEEGSYTEKAQFTNLKDGQRSWVTYDTYLQSLTNKSINIAFAMVVAVEDKK